MINKYRRLFPITRETVYFNHAGTGPLSLPARRVIEDCVKTYLKQAEFNIDEYFAHVQKARAMVARLIGAAPEEITLTHNTSEGIYIALVNLPLKPGDKILVMDEVFPAVRYVVEYNLPFCVKKYIPLCGQDPVAVVKNNLDNNVKAVVVDFVQFLTGEVIDLKALSYFLKEKEIYLIVDGIQAIGAIDFNVQDCEIDFLACGAAKWLFGPSGAGFLYINKKNFKNLNRLHTGWLGAAWQNFEHFESLPPIFEDGRMFEQGTRNIIGIRAMCENIKILLEFGLKNIEIKINNLKDDLRQKFKDLKFEIVTPEYGIQSGIITVKPNGDSKTIFRWLKDNKVIISLRNDLLRFSPHFYNTKEEVGRIINILKS